MDLEEEFGMMLLIHFGQPLKKKRLKCKYCADYLSNVCEGKELNRKGVIKCMKDKVFKSEFVCSDEIA